jgi:hypothetical protein
MQQTRYVNLKETALLKELNGAASFAIFGVANVVSYGSQAKWIREKT